MANSGDGRGKLKVALACEVLYPPGGREHQCLAVAAELVARGHEVSIYAAVPPRYAPQGVSVVKVRRRGWSNHERKAAFAEDVVRAAKGLFDRTVVFHLVPGFDLIFCAEPARSRQWWRVVTPRYRRFIALEGAALRPGSPTRVMVVTSGQRAAFAKIYGTRPEQCVVLPPAIDPSRVVADLPADGSRTGDRPRDGSAWLWVGLQPNTKGLDRAVQALAASPTARLQVCGVAESDAKAGAARRLAGRLGVADRIQWLGLLDSATLSRAMVSADLLMHPARADVAGMVILEAMANGLPVITSEVCGYAEHVAGGQAGVVVPEPFAKDTLAAAVAIATPERLALWSANALAYTRGGALFSGIARAADVIEEPLP